MGSLEVKLNMSTAYHPQLDGQTERVNQCLENYLRGMCYNQLKKWHKWLSMAEWWYNSCYHTAIKTSPFKALYRYDPPQLALGSNPRIQVESVNEMLRNRHGVLRQLKENLRKSQERMKFYIDNHRTERQFKEGDWVYLKIQPYRQVTIAGMQNQKLNPKFFGPYEIIERVGAVAYRLNLPLKSSIHHVFHVSQLKARVSDSQAVSPSILLVRVQGPHYPQPLAILARRMVKKRNAVEPQVLIQWMNQSVNDATWEDYKSIKEKYPDFVLEVENGLKEGRVSQPPSDLEIAVGNFYKSADSIEEEGLASKEGSEAGIIIERSVTLKAGPT